MMEEANLNTVFQKQKQSFLIDSYSDYEFRKELLKKLFEKLIVSESTLYEALNKDYGCRARDEFIMSEFYPCIHSLKFTLKNLKKWMKPKRVKTGIWFIPGTSKIMLQPLGVVGVMVPWNFPLSLAVVPLVSALAAGNRVMIKLSEFTPHFNKVFMKMIGEIFPDTLVYVTEGNFETSKSFSNLPYDHLFFTGSTQVGREVMKAAAANLTPVTLELGGKSPVVIDDQYSLKDAVDKIIFGKCLNSGQACIAPDYVFVPESKVNQFVELSKEAFHRMYPTVIGNGDYNSIIDERNYQKLLEYKEDAKRKGAQIFSLSSEKSEDIQKRKISLTIITHVTDGMKVMENEIFGPLLPVIPYKNIEDVLTQIKNKSKPLALYVFSHRSSFVKMMLEQVIAGGVTVNDTTLHYIQDNLPFGGVGESGMGHYHGEYGFETFSKKKAVFYQSIFGGFKMMRPPYGIIMRFLSYMMLRF